MFLFRASKLLYDNDNIWILNNSLLLFNRRDLVLKNKVSFCFLCQFQSAAPHLSTAMMKVC